MTKRVSFCVQIPPGATGATTIKLKKKIISTLEHFGGREIGQRRIAYGSHKIETDFVDRDSAVRAAVECFLIGSEMGYDLTSFVDDVRLDIFPEYWAANSIDEIDMYREDQAVIGLVNGLWQRYRDIGGQLSRTEFVFDCLAKVGGVDRVYVEEGLKPAFA